MTITFTPHNTSYSEPDESNVLPPEDEKAINAMINEGCTNCQ